MLPNKFLAIVIIIAFSYIVFKFFSIKIIKLVIDLVD